MTFDADFAESGWPALAPHFSETVVIWPHGGLPKTVSAIVNRSPPGDLLLDGRARPRLVITVENHPTRGHTADELDTGGDQVEVAVKQGGTPELLPIRLFLGDDGGCLTFGV